VKLPYAAVPGFKLTPPAARGEGHSTHRIADARKSNPMNTRLKEILRNPLLWLLAFVPVVFAAAKLKPVTTARHD
jgi:hypothetical protein